VLKNNDLEVAAQDVLLVELANQVGAFAAVLQEISPAARQRALGLRDDHRDEVRDGRAQDRRRRARARGVEPGDPGERGVASRS